MEAGQGVKLAWRVSTWQAMQPAGSQPCPPSAAAAGTQLRLGRAAGSPLGLPRLPVLDEVKRLDLTKRAQQLAALRKQGGAGEPAHSSIWSARACF